MSSWFASLIEPLVSACAFQPIFTKPAPGRYEPDAIAGLQVSLDPNPEAPPTLAPGSCASSISPSASSATTLKDGSGLHRP